MLKMKAWARSLPALRRGLASGVLAEDRPRSGLVAAAFANLNDQPHSPRTSQSHKMNQQIEQASDVESLLSAADRRISRYNLLRVMSKLSDWLSQNKIKLADLEADKRFANLCRNLSASAEKSEDLNTVLGVAGDDEATRLVRNLDLHQTVKVLVALGQKKRRSTPLLKAISFKLACDTDNINIKQASDILYSIATLNYPDVQMVQNVCKHVSANLDKSIKSSAIGSVVTSLGMLKFKHPELMDRLAEWMHTNKDICRIQDVAALVTTAAIVNHKLDNRFSKLQDSDFLKPTLYLDYVWSLVVLDIASEEQVQSTLTQQFVNSLIAEGGIPFPSVKKLCNINAYAAHMKYKEATLPKEYLNSIELVYSKDKRQFVDGLLDTLKNLLASESNMKTNCDSKMGFLFDASMLLDKKCNPYPVDKTISKEKEKSLIKVAVLGLDYHDFCINVLEPLGSIQLYKRLLEGEGYKVLTVPFFEFNTQEKLAYRIQLVEKKLKTMLAEQ